MLPDAIRALFGPKERGDESHDVGDGVDPVHLAACALLLDIAYADGEFSAPERAHLESVLARHFSLPPDAGQRLIALAEAERKRSIDHFHFTRVLQSSYDVGQKMVLAEVMWGLVLADGQIADHEHYLTRKIANLLDLAPGYLSAAKQAAAEKAGGSEPGASSP
jgi:uncharacterized tellurite resistance protein B-like protein